MTVTTQDAIDWVRQMREFEMLDTRQDRIFRIIETALTSATHGCGVLDPEYDVVCTLRQGHPGAHYGERSTGIVLW